MIGVIDVLGEYFRAVRLWDLEGEELVGCGMIGEEGKVRDVHIFWGTVIVIMDRGIRDIVDWWKGLRDFSFLNMIDFFEGSDSGLSVIHFCGSEDRVEGMENGSVGNGVFVGSVGGRTVEAVMHRHDRRVKVREERRVLIEICEAS